MATTAKKVASAAKLPSKTRRVEPQPAKVAGVADSHRSPLSAAVNVLKKDPVRAMKIAIAAGIVTKKTHKLTKDYA